MKTPAVIGGLRPGGNSTAISALGLTIFFLSLGLFLPGSGSATAGALDPETGQVEVLIQGQELITIRADRIEYDENLGLTSFSGRVSLRRGLETLSADRAIWHNQTGSAEVSGSVRLESPNFMMEAERAVVNLELSLAKIYQGRAFFHRSNYYLNGTVIERLSENKFQVTKASATTCDGPSPAWTIQAEHLTITEGGYAAGPGMVFKGVGSTMPLFALPYFVFPVKTERQSGLLAPTVGTSSQNGLMASLPFFWATGENHDLTLTPVWRENRGLSSNLEGRYHVDWGRGLWHYSYLKDQADRYYDFDHPRRDAQRRHARERSWLRAQNQGRSGDWDVNLNLDLVSDPLYLKEFPNDPDGFNQSARAFSSTFGHTLNEALDPNRANALYAQKLDGSTQTRAGIYYTQNLNNEANRDTTQRLPTLQYDLVGHEVLDSGFQSPRLSLNTRYDNFYRLTDEKSETTETGHRLRFQPTVDWAESLGLAGLKVAGGLDMAAYAADGRRPPSTMETGHDEHWYNLMSGSAEAELSTTFSRVFEGGPGRATATRHQISPTLALSYVSAPEDQGRLPYWDHLDRRLPRQTWRYGLSNSLVAKTPGQSPGAEESQGTPADNYFQFLKFGIWTSYEMADNRHLTNNIADRYYDTNYYGRGPGPLETHMEAFFNPHISMRMISSFNTRTGQPISHDLNLNMADGRGDRLNLIYDYNAPKAKGIPGASTHQQARGTLDLRLNSEWSGSFSTRYDLNGNRALESTTRLAYQAQCYGLSLFFTKTYREQSVGLMVDLLGLGTIDSSTAFANSDNI